MEAQFRLCWKVVIQKGLCEQVESNLISQWIVGLALQKAKGSRYSRQKGSAGEKDSVVGSTRVCSLQSQKTQGGKH